jgi:predicted membrane protein
VSNAGLLCVAAVHCGVSTAQAVLGDDFLYLTAIRDRRAFAHSRSERGAGKLKTVFFVLVLLLLIYSAVKIIPAYVSDYQLSDKMQEQARFSVVNRYSEEQIRENLFKTVQELEIPAKREDIKIVANNAMVKISLSYTVPVDLFFYHLDLHFSPSSENKALF